MKRTPYKSILQYGKINLGRLQVKLDQTGRDKILDG